MRSNVRKEGCILHFLLVHDTFSIVIYQKVRLPHDVCHAARKIIDPLDHSCLLNTDRKMVSSCLPCHAQTVPHDTRDREVEHVNAVIVSCLLFNEVFVASCSACTDDSRLAVYFHFISVFVRCKNSGYFTIFHDNLFRRCLKQHLNAQLLRSRVQRFVHE